MQDFLSFNNFITPGILIVFYYTGAIAMPLFLWVAFRWLKHRYLPDYLPPKRIYLYILFLFCFLCMELFWRMLFEVMIAYFDMHDALMKMSGI